MNSIHKSRSFHYKNGMTKICFLFCVLLMMTSFGPCTWAASQKPNQMRVCYLHAGFLPFTTPQQDEPWQVLVAKAGEKVGVPIDFYAVPRERCFLDLKAGRSDAIYSAWTDERAEIAVFPMRGSELDPKKAVGLPVTRVYRKKGSQVGWDGHRFSNLGLQSIGSQRGLYMTRTLQKMKMPLQISDSSEQLLIKLDLGRLAASVIIEEQADIVFRKHPNLDLKIEKLPVPFASDSIYLAVSKKYYQAHKESVEKFWDAIAEIRPTMTGKDQTH